MKNTTTSVHFHKYINCTILEIIRKDIRTKRQNFYMVISGKIREGLFFLILLLSVIFSEVIAQNAIVLENAKPGNPASEWQISGAGDPTIQGYATDISYNKGETARFKIKSNANAYTINIYRLGYYQGNGARLQGSATLTATLPQSQPNCLTDSNTGLLDCGNWTQSATWNIPASAVSGLYLAKLTRTNNGGSSHIAFIVRDDTSNSDILFQTSDATWQAYNVYGDNNNGKSLYTGSGGKAVKVSYNRPFITRDGGGGGGPSEDWLFNAEYPMIRWLEANGYDMTYTTNVDSDRRGNLIRNHKVFLSVGHDEYWSGTHKANVLAARNAGTHMAFFSGNEVYWKTRWENSIDGNGVSHRTLVCYKEGTLGENTCGGKCDPSPEWTGLWRDGCTFAGAGGCQPENALTGQISWELSDASLEVPSEYKNLRFWRNTSVANLSTGQKASFTYGTIGYEWNSEQELYRSSYPNGRILLSRTVIGGKVHNISLYKHNSGALVFGAGTVQWSWGLDGNHDRGNAAPSLDMQQATLNLFADMGTQPGTRQPGLVAATASTDTQAPVTVISSPVDNASSPVGVELTITGTASDNQVLAGVEVSTDGGSTWSLATGNSNWSYKWTPTVEGAATIQSRAFDDSGNMGAPVIVNLNITGQVINCPCTVFEPTAGPTGQLLNDGQALQLGMKFRSSVNGFVSGVRFYKQSGNTGTHIGQLYSRTGSLLAQATFINET
ncbi:N,N-dimethylformamidase beta subunit family domain-containing protein, partial [Gillisia limnaea]